jgi:hypothetical protein
MRCTIGFALVNSSVDEMTVGVGQACCLCLRTANPSTTIANVTATLFFPESILCRKFAADEVHKACSW